MNAPPLIGLYLFQIKGFAKGPSNFFNAVKPVDTYLGPIAFNCKKHKY